MLVRKKIFYGILTVRSVVLSFLLFGILWAQPVRCSADTVRSPRDKKVEFFAGGKKYSSFEKYRSEKFKAIAVDEFQKFLNVDFDLFLASVLAVLPPEERAVLTEKEYRALLDDTFTRLYSIDRKAVREDHTVRQVNDMLEEYNRAHAGSPIQSIDPTKMKTIELPKK